MAVHLAKPLDLACAGCGADAGEPCNPLMGCHDMAREPQYGSAQTYREVGWRLRKEVSREAYLRDLAYADDLRFCAHEWRGEDREGTPLTISWIVTPTETLLAAYEIQGRA